MSFAGFSTTAGGAKIPVMFTRAWFPAVLAVLAMAAPAAALEPDRDFSGSWVLDAHASNTRELTAEADPLLVIMQIDMRLRCSAPVATGAREWTFTADGAESEYVMGQEKRNTAAKWEGSALLVNTLVSGPRNYTIMDRWKLSPDRSVLTIERQVVRAGGSAEATLVYRRQGQLELLTRAPAVPAGAPSPSGPAAPAAPTPPSPASAVAVPQQNQIVLPPGTRIQLALLSSVSTKYAQNGDRVYLETAFPVFVSGRLVVPRGSYVTGTLTKPAPAKGKPGLYLRFDSLTLPNGVTRDFLAPPGTVDASAAGSIDREGKVTGKTDGTEVRQVAKDTALGGMIGGMGGAVAGHSIVGMGVGLAVGSIASISGAKKKDMVLPKGMNVEMVLDRELSYKPEELRF
jgi:hypothetical protein